MKLNHVKTVSAFYMLLESCKLQDRMSKYVKLKGCDHTPGDELFGASLQTCPVLACRRQDEEVSSLLDCVWVCPNGLWLGCLHLTSAQLLAAESEPKVTGRSERFPQVHFLRFGSDSNDLRAPESVSWGVKGQCSSLASFTVKGRSVTSFRLCWEVMA